MIKCYNENDKKVRLVRTRVPYFVPNLTVVQAAIKASKK